MELLSFEQSIKQAEEIDFYVDCDIEDREIKDYDLNDTIDISTVLD